MNHQHQFVSEWVMSNEQSEEIFSDFNEYLDSDQHSSCIGVYEIGEPELREEPYAMATLDFPPKESYRQVEKEQYTVLLVEFRDEVYARVEADMVEAGIRVLRAETVDEALRLSQSCPPGIVVANLDLTDQSGWLLATKLKFIEPEISVWLYQAQSSIDDKGMADFLQVEQLVDYHGDLFRLSKTIVGLMTERLFPCTNSEITGYYAPQFAVA